MRPRFKPAGSSRSKPSDSEAEKTNKLVDLVIFGKAAMIMNATEKSSDLPITHKIGPSRHERAAKNTQITEKNKI